MGASTHEDHLSSLAVIIDRIDEQEIAADMAFAMAGPIAFQRMIALFRPERSVIGDQEKHRFLEPAHVVPPRTRKAFPQSLRNCLV